MITDLLTRQGEIDLERVNQMSRAEIDTWILERLHGGDGLVPGGMRDEEPAYALFARIYDRVDRTTRSYIESVLLDALRNAAKPDTERYEPEALDQVLLLVQELKDPSFEAPVRKLTTEGRFLQPDSDERLAVDLHARLLQTLSVLDGLTESSFWINQFEASPGRFGPIVFSHLLPRDPEAAIDLLPRLDWNDEDVPFQVYTAFSRVAQADTELPDPLIRRSLDLLHKLENRVSADAIDSLRAVLQRLSSSPQYRFQRAHMPDIPAAVRRSSAQETFFHQAGLDSTQFLIVVLREGLGPNPRHSFKEISRRLSSEQQQFGATEIRSLYQRCVQQTRFYRLRRGGRGGPSLNVREIYSYLAETEDIPQITTDT